MASGLLSKMTEVDIILFLFYLAWLGSWLTKWYHFSSSSTLMSTALIAFLHMSELEEIRELSSFIIWLVTAISVYSIIKQLRKAEKWTEVITGVYCDDEK